ncbi:NLR family CARD domain-containing protein 3-like [Spea bombifrons]|uniref:NLR family CARD domain-containing protein 3-like n=1 Tax=Spea bombifrons TaxID=233779 RepID=UPI00234AA7F7|nr:NLR family CARD domain-containing protein 3-like [Spea bombifrons]
MSQDSDRCLACVRSRRSDLAKWIEQNPVVVLRWLYEAGAFPQEKYHSLLKCSPQSNQVISLLEVVTQDEEICKTFVHVLQQVQEYYSLELQKWLRNTFPSYFKQPLGSIEKEKCDKNGSWRWTKIKSKLMKKSGYDMGCQGKVISTSIKMCPLKASLQNHKQSLLKQTSKVQGNLGTSYSCCEMLEIRYTELFITNDEPSGTPPQHEYFGLANRRARIFEHNKHQRISLTKIVSPLEPDLQQPRKVLVTGIAGIGKSLAMRRLMHEWAIGMACRNVSCVIHFAFRELNLIEYPISFLDLIKQYHAHLQNVAEELCNDPTDLLVILDGLDEFKHQVNDGKHVHSITEQVFIKDLIHSLLKGTLLSRATIVVTSRPHTSTPLENFDRKVVILGFEEKQVKEFCSRFFNDKVISEEVFQYIRQNDTLSGLSFIPLYCFIICTALSHYFPGGEADNCSEQPPQTMTEVYRSYLCTIMHHHMRNIEPKIGNSEQEPIAFCSPPVFAEMKDVLYQLGKMAYYSLLNNRILFYREDLKTYGFDPSQLPDSFLHRVFVHVDGLGQTEMFSFFHMTLQEYFAALYCVISMSSAPEELLQCLDLWCLGTRPREPVPSQLLSSTLKTMTAHWENLQMFSRFFAGLLSYRIKGKLQGLVEPLSEDILNPVADWFKGKIQYAVNQSLLNLLHCLRELEQRTVVEKVAPDIDEVNLFKVTLNPSDCATLSYVLQHSTTRLKMLNLGYANIGMQGLRRLQPLLHRCQTLHLRYNSLDKEAAIMEANVLKSPTCQVRCLLMCGNSIGSEGAQHLWEALSSNQTLEELYVDITGITDSGLDNLLPCLTNNTTLKVITIVGNNLSEQGKKMLRELQRLRPTLKILSTFLGDMGLLQAYIDWVQDLKEDPRLMDSAKNADALRNVFKELNKEESGETNQDLEERKEKLKDEISKLLGDSLMSP